MVLRNLHNFDEEGSGSLVADGSQQTIREFVGLGKLSAYIDLSAMQPGDTVTIRQSMKIKATGVYGKYAEETYTNTQALTMLTVALKPAKHGVMITLQQTAGTYRSFDWETFVEYS